jgi:hypothetical protein
MISPPIKKGHTSAPLLLLAYADYLPAPPFCVLLPDVPFCIMPDSFNGGSLLHVPLALSLTMLLNIFDVLIIEHGEVGPSFFVRTKELVELGVKSLGIAVFGSINEQRHQPRC